VDNILKTVPVTTVQIQIAILALAPDVQFVKIPTIFKELSV